MCKTFLSNLFILLFIFSNAFTQTTGKLSGRVIDKESGEPLAGSNISIEGTQMGAAADPNGEFFIINVPPGIYSLVARMIGYGAVKMENILVSVNSTTNLSFELSPEVIKGEEVVVTAKTMAIKKDQTSSIRNISSNDIKLLPVETISEILQLQPGVVGKHFRGGRSDEVSYMVDGVKVTESFNHEASMVELNPEVVQDMEVITGTFNAEYGNAMSGIVNLITKDGSNTIHGAGSVNLGSFSTSHKDKFVGLKNTDARIQDYTLSLSGPIIRNYLNFVVDTRYLKNRGYLNGIARFKVDDYSDFRSFPQQFTSSVNGDSSFVDLDNNEKTFFLGKLIFKPTPVLKTSFVYTFNENNFQNYNYLYFYDPFGMPGTHNKSQMAAFHLNHTLSPKAFYELKLSYNKFKHGDYVYKNPLDSRYVSDFYSTDSGPWFFTGGQDKNHTQRTEEKYGLKFDLTWQLHKNHSLKTGIDLTKIRLNQNYSDIRNQYEGTSLESVFATDSTTNQRTYTYYTPEVRPDSSVFSDMYVKEPIQFAAYVQDKMEFQSMVINFGVRLDYFDPRTVYPTNWRNPANQDFFQDKSRTSQYPAADAQYQFSPRLGLSYKLGEAALLRFSYGHFLQIPPLNYFYQNNTFRITELGRVGNPLLKAQKTISYEIGLWLELTEKMNIEATVFYRDIRDLLSSRLVYTYSQIRYGLFDNKDYGNARGLELRYEFRSGGLSLNTNYTLQFTRGVADSPEFAFNRAGQDMDPVNKLIPLEWDQRHTLNIMASYNSHRYGVSVRASYYSGRPYSWRPITESPLALINLLPNNQTRPSQFNVDLQAHYQLFSVGNMGAELTLLAFNIFDRLNENVVNSTTGRAYTGIVRSVDNQSYRSNFTTFTDIFQNPSMFAAPRSVKLGLGFNF